VYNLKVEGEPEFYANGVLVHNCDVLSYACDLLPFVRNHTGGVGGMPFFRYEHKGDVYTGLK
jgi:hypothetical protein